MIKRTLVLTLALSFPAFSLAETVVTTDGRTIILNEDGTYVIELGTTLEVDKHIELQEPLFRYHSGDFGQESIRFIPKLKNKSDTAIVGVRFTASFRSAFGDEIFKFNGDMNERIAPGASSTAKVFYVFEDNPFISDEVYDKLIPMVHGDTGSVVVTVSAIAMDGGAVLQFE